MPVKGQKRKMQIIDTAKEMFLQNGYQSTHIGQVCEKLDIARGTVYQYFGNKREIIFAVMDSVEEEIQDIFDTDDLEMFLTENIEKEKIIEFIVERMSKCVKTVITEPIIIKLLFKEITGIDKEVVKYNAKFIGSITKILARDLEIIKQRTEFKKKVDSYLTSVLMIGGVLLLVHEYDREKKNIMAKEIIKSVVDVYMNGILM